MRQLVESSPVAPTGPTWDALRESPPASSGQASGIRWLQQHRPVAVHPDAGGPECFNEDIDVDFADCRLDRGSQIR